MFTGGFAPALVFGVAVGNVLQGLPFRLDGDLRAQYTGTFLGLFTPFTLVCGLLSVAMLVLHGAAWLSMKAEKGPVRDRATTFGMIAGVSSMLLFVVGFAFVAFGNMGYSIVGAADVSGPSNPPHTLSILTPAGWLTNFADHPVLWLAPCSASPARGRCAVRAGQPPRLGRVHRLFAIGGGDHLHRRLSDVSLHPCPVRSIDPRSSLTVWNASSSQLTLFIMLGVTVVFLPIVLAYTAWAYKVMWGRSTTGALSTNPDLY